MKIGETCMAMKNTYGKDADGSLGNRIDDDVEKAQDELEWEDDDGSDERGRVGCGICMEGCWQSL